MGKLGTFHACFNMQTNNLCNIFSGHFNPVALQFQYTEYTVELKPLRYSITERIVVCPVKSRYLQIWGFLLSDKLKD